jgi:hypothetical protein
VVRPTAPGGAGRDLLLLLDAADHLYAAAALLEELGRRAFGDPSPPAF